MHENILILCGPTASGKSALALTLAKALHAVIINADSMQIYRELPILTAQPDAETQQQTPHRLYGFVPASEAFSVAQWLDHAEKEITHAHASGKLALIVGGTGLYLKCLMEGVAIIPDIVQEIRHQARELLNELGNKEFHILLNERDPVMGEKLNPGDTQRMLRAWEVLEQTNQSIHAWQQKPHKALYNKEQFTGIFLHPPREELYARCDARFLQMLEQGALEEVKVLDTLGLSPDLPVMKALGVPELRAHLHGELSLEDAITRAQTNTRRYAKRQITWFRNQFSGFKEVQSVEEGEILIGNL